MSYDDRLPITKISSCLIAAATWCTNQSIRLENFETARVLYGWVIHGFLASGCREPKPVPSRVSATNATVSPDGLIEFEWAKGDSVAGSQDRALLLALSHRYWIGRIFQKPIPSSLGKVKDLSWRLDDWKSQYWLLSYLEILLIPMKD